MLMRDRLKGLYHGDCVEQLPLIDTDSVDLIYLDPPYGSNQDYDEFHDKYTRQEYYDLIHACMVECKRVLKPDSSIYVHVHMMKSHVVRWIMDEVFGEKCFGNEIILPTNISRGSDKKPRHWTKGHYSIMRYCLGRHYFEPIWRELPLEVLHQRYPHIDKDGRRYKKEKMVHTQTRKSSEAVNFTWQGITPPRGWIHPAYIMDGYLEKGIVHFDGKWPVFRKYLDERIGHILSDVWDDMHLTSHEERTGYPTQKPMRLLDRIITTSTPVGATVLDPFCGSGTTLISAMYNERYAIGIDISQAAIDTVNERIDNMGML